MAKAKILSDLITPKGGLAQEVRLKLPRSNLDIYYQDPKRTVKIMKKGRPGKKRTYKQHEQRTLYCDCDLLYRLLKARFMYILTSWFNGLEASEKKTLTMNNVFMKRCLKRDLADLLFNYFYINIGPVELYEENNFIIIKAKLYQMSQEEYLESFLEPLRLKY